MNKCPGQDARNLTAETYRCPNCGSSVEIFSDEQRRRCPVCKAMVFTEETPSCIQWCKAARECLGPERYEAAMRRLRDAEGAGVQDGSRASGDRQSK
jgi:DNA-directed RNA polymerase subunit RPC12/RpoP